MYLTPGSEWTLVQSGLDNHVTTYAQACYKVEIVSNPGFLQSCHNLVTSLLQPVYNLCTTYIYNPSCTKVVTTWLQPCTFCMGYHTTGRKSYTVDSGMTLCCVTLMCTDVDSLCDAHYYSAMHSLHAESETNDISMVGMIVTVHIPYICSTTKLTT